jgi:hypothetical protein
MHQIPPSPMLVLGAEPIALAISSIAKLAIEQCYYYTDLSEVSTIDFAHLPIILSVSPLNTCISQIHYLRSRLQWGGTLIAITNNSSECQKLKDTCIFGERHSSRFLYGKIPGHIALNASSSCLITDIMSSVYEDTGLDYNTWRDYYVAKSSIYPILEELNKDVPSLASILYIIHQVDVDWNIITSHKNARFIEDLRTKYPVGKDPPNEMVVYVLDEIKHAFVNITR